MENYPSLNTLVAGMKPPSTQLGSKGSTNLWDIVVSYSVDQLNTLLQQAWKTNSPIPPAGITLEVEDIDDEEDPPSTFTREWILTLSPPSLTFASSKSGNATLTMILNGTYRRLGKKDDGTEYPLHTLPKDTYNLVISLPLQFVSATEEKGVTTIKPKGDATQIISFDDDKTASLHIVFNFATSNSPDASYKIVARDGKSQVPTGILNLLTGLALYMSNDQNLAGVKYALAEVRNDKPAAGTQTLTPKQVAFTIYAPSIPNKGNTGVGCLSVYIKADETGDFYPPGNANRSFKLLSDDTETYPIPSQYTASIIIRHQVFAEFWLKQALLDAKDDNGSSFFKSVDVEGTSDGIQLRAKLNSWITPDFKDKKWWGGYSINNVSWSLSDTDAYLSLKDEGLTWSYFFSNECEWEARVLQDRRWGVALYKTTLLKFSTAFTKSSDSGLEVQLNLDSGDWKPEATYKELSFKDKVLGQGSNYLPDEIKNRLLNISLPQVHRKMDLDYFATTNIFAPGKHFISVDGPQNAFTPYDVLIVGNVTNSISPKTIVKSLVQDPKVKARVPVVSAPKKKTPAQYIRDMQNSQPILGQTLAAITSDDPRAVDNLIKNSEYDINVDALEKLVKDSSEGSNFDITRVAGLYHFNEANFQGNYMMIDPSNGRMTINETYVSNQTTPEGLVTFTYQKVTYLIKFTVAYNLEDGSLLPTTFSGAAIEAPKAPISGFQFVKKPDDKTNVWGSVPILATAFVLGGVSFLMTAGGLILAIRECVRTKAPSKAAKQAVKNTQQNLPDAAVSVNLPKLNLRDYRYDMEGNIIKEVAVALKNDDKTEDAKLSIIAQDAARVELKNMDAEVIGTPLKDKLSGFKDILGEKALDDQVDIIVEQRTKDTYDALSADSTYIKSTVEAEHARINKSVQDNKVDEATTEYNALDQKLNDAKEEIKEKQDGQEEYKQKLVEEEKTETEIEKAMNEYAEDLQKKIADAEQVEKNKEAKDGERTEHQNKADEEAEKERKARERANEAGEEVYGEK